MTDYAGRMLFAAISVAAGAMFAESHEYKYVWNASDPATSFGDGKVTIELAESLITSVNMDVPLRDVVSVSGDAMSFASGATVTVERGELRFSGGLTAAGDISFAKGTNDWSWTADESTRGLLQDVYMCVHTDLDLDDVAGVKAHLSASASGGSGVYNADSYHIVRGDGWLETQLQQCLGEGATTKTVKIRLEQQGSDVYAKIVYARFVESTNVLGMDFDTGADGVTVKEINVCTSTSVPQYYYGCDRLLLLPVVAPSVSVCGPYDGQGKVRIGDGMRVVFKNNRTEIDSLGLGDGVLAVGADGSADKDITEYVHEGYLDDVWQLFAVNRTLAEIDPETISGKLAGGNLVKTPTEALVCFVKWNQEVPQCEFHLKTASSTMSKGVLVKFRQNGSDVEFCPVKCYYYEGEAGEKSFTSEGCVGAKYAASCESDGYCLAGISASTKTIYASSVTIDKGGLTTNGVIEVSGESADRHAEVRIVSDTGLPTNGVVKVGQYGVLSLLCAPDFLTGISGGSCEIFIGPGGLLRQGGDYNFPMTLRYDRQHVTIDGGRAEFGCECTKNSSTADAVDTSGSTYLNSLTLKNGARCGGSAVRVGNANATWKICGTSPSYWDTSISMLGPDTANSTRTAEFNVDDVTGSADVDFTVAGDMRMFKPNEPSKYKQLRVVKSGTGTMLVQGVTDFTNKPLEILGGTWMVGSSNTMSPAQNVLLDGGCFASADGVAASVGRLSVGASGGGIKVDNGANVSFLDSSTETWSGTVELTCGEGSSVRFGTSPSALTGTQQKMLRLNGRRAVLDSNGFSVAIGFAVIVR